MTETSAQPTFQSEPRMNWKRILLGIIMGAIVVGVIAITFWYLTRPNETENFSITSTKTATSSAKTATTSAKKDEIADWRTYTSIKYGYSIKFPANLGDSDEIFDNPSAPRTYFGKKLFLFTIEVQETGQKLQDLEKNLSNPKYVRINNYDAISFSGPANGVFEDGTKFAYLLINKGKLYSIYFGNTATEIQKDQILSTFEFLD